jgi:Secretion system C-terminal sorting domain
MKTKILLYLLVFNISIFAQMSELVIMPHHINFMNKFDRRKTVRLINKGQNNISIDSIKYDSSMLYISNNNFSGFPISLRPDSSISINVRLANYFTLKGEDSSTVVNVFNNSRDAVKDITVNVEFQMLHRMGGVIKGSVKDSLNYLSEAKVYFFFDGIYLIDSTTTDNNGNYEKQLRYGNYFVSAVKRGYYLQYSDFKNSPLDANFVEVKKDNPQIINFVLELEVETDLSISGKVLDIFSDGVLSKAIVVVRKGDHNPTKIQASTTIDPMREYSVMTNPNGEYNIRNIQTGGDYYLQAFSQYFIPGYFNHMSNHETHWQNADSINVFGLELGKNIYLERDSSYGGGVARGRVRKNNNHSDSTKNSLIYAVSTSNNEVYNYSYSRTSGDFVLPALPSGNYKLVTDKIGYDSSVSDEFVVGLIQDTVINIDLILLPTSIKQASEMATTFSLSQNYPNPFNPSTTIEFTTDKYDNISLTIYNLLGQKVAELVNGNFNSGNYKVTFDASQLTSGIYIYQFKSSSNVIAKKMELLK